jgi:glutamyl-tRNA synthetase
MSHSTSKIVTRFAPSPTGAAHAGSYRTAMFAWLFARHHNGEFVLRIEDTDTARNQEGSDTQIIESLAWLGIDYDHMYRQSDQVDRHKQVMEELIANGSAYISREEAKDGSGIVKEIVRFKNPNIPVTVHDLIRGEVVVNTTDLGDFVIGKSLIEPIFHLANVVDDHDEGITHVIRAEEHLANTPRQILIFQAMGWDIPTYAHLPIVLGTDKQKLSKRRGALPMLDYRNMGYLPGAVFNCVAMVGWNPGNGSEQEIFSREELIQNFDLAHVQKGSAVFNEEKLNWFNREYIKMLDIDTQKGLVKQYLPSDLLEKMGTETFEKLFSVIIERVEYFGQVSEWAESGEYDYVVSTPVYDIAKVIWKTCDAETTQKHLQHVHDTWSAYTGEWDNETLKSLVWEYGQTHGAGNVLWPLRYTLTGRDKSPDPFTVAYILGRDEVLVRLKKAINLL